MLLLISVVFLTVIQQGSSLKCYNCNSLYEDKCDNPGDETELPSVECYESDMFCYEQHYNMTEENGNTIFVQRGCSPGNFCPEILKSEPLPCCSLCTTDLCNGPLGDGASSIMVSNVLSIISTVFFIATANNI